MATLKFSCLALAAALTGVAAQAEAQQGGGLLQVGAEAPDFAITGATRYGILKEPVHLSDFEGKTVVLAFFYRARTRG